MTSPGAHIDRSGRRSTTLVGPQQLLHIAGFVDGVPTRMPAMDSSLTRCTDSPKLSVDQRREALARTNAVRFKRAAIKAALKNGELSIVGLVTEPPQYLASARIKELLLACPGFGRVKVERLLERCKVSPARPSLASTTVSAANLSRHSASYPSPELHAATPAEPQARLHPKAAPR